MNLIEYHTLIDEGLKINYVSQYTLNSENAPYNVKNLKLLRDIILKLGGIPLIDKEIDTLKASWIFTTHTDNVMVTSTDNSLADNTISRLKVKLSLMKEINDNSGLIDRVDLLYIKLPELASFDDLTKYSNDLKKAIEIPIIDESINGNVTIIGADQGSVILYAALGTILAVKLVAGICWAAVLLKKKNAEAKIFEAHAKTLDIKNESLQNIVDAQKQQLKNILQAEAEAIASKYYNHNDPETIERLKLSISSVAELVEKGAKILPMNKDEEIQKSFPDYNPAKLIESSIKQLKENS